MLSPCGDGTEHWREAEHHLARGVQLDPTLTKTNAAMRRAIKTVEARTCEGPKATGWEDLAVAAVVGQKGESAAENLSCSGDIGLAFIE